MTICLGKSTYARCGIIVNVTPFEPEWEGYVTLEFSNTTPLPAKIYANEGVAQVLFFESDEVCETSYKGPRREVPGPAGRHVAEGLSPAPSSRDPRVVVVSAGVAAHRDACSRDGRGVVRTRLHWANTGTLSRQQPLLATRRARVARRGRADELCRSSIAPPRPVLSGVDWRNVWITRSSVRTRIS